MIRPPIVHWWQPRRRVQPAAVSTVPFPVALGGLTFLLAAGATVAVEPTDSASPLQKVVSYVGMSRLGFSRVNENDAKAAYRILNAELGRKYGYDLTTEMSLFDSPPEFTRAVRSGAVTLILCSSWELLSLGIEDAVDIEFSAVTSGRVAHRWLLLVRRDSGFKTAGDLQGRHAIVLHNNMATLGTPWIETTLLDKGLGSPGRFFGKYENVSRPSAAVLPVFFGKAHACVVDQAAFDVMVELNPQVGQVLEPVAVSEPLLNGLTCFNRQGWVSAKARDDMKRSLGELDREPAGRQILTLFKCDRVVPFEPAQLEAVRRLYARHQQLTHPKP